HRRSLGFCPFSGTKAFLFSALLPNGRFARESISAVPTSYIYQAGKEVILMVRPEYSEIVRLAGQYDVIPVCREIYADITTPIAVLRTISRTSSRYFLLESIEGGERWGRYSFLGYDPIARITCRNGEITIEGSCDRRKTTLHTRKPLEVQ